MKILYVEENPSHRELTENHLSQVGHQVDLYLPEESIFGSNPTNKDKEILTFANETDLVGILTAGDYNAAVLNAEAFRQGEPTEMFIRRYLDAISSSEYSGKIVVTTTLSSRYNEAFFGENNLDEVQVLGKPFGFKMLDEVLENKVD
jgi:hypothetical protein